MPRKLHVCAVGNLVLKRLRNTNLMGDSVKPGRDEAEECMVEFLGGSREDVEAVADCKVAGPGGVGADFFFFVLEGALGLEDGLLAMVGALARAPRA